MRIIKIICFSLFLLISLSYLFIIISPKLIKGFYPFGIKTAVVLTGSMEPMLEINDFVIMKKPTEIKVNDIISYKQVNSENEVLHRVIRINGNVVVTKGDANNTEDKPINLDQVTGVYIGKIEYLGNIIFFIKKPILFSTIITLFFIIMLIPSKEISNVDKSDYKKQNLNKNLLHNVNNENNIEPKGDAKLDSTIPIISNVEVIDKRSNSSKKSTQSSNKKTNGTRTSSKKSSSSKKPTQSSNKKTNDTRTSGKTSSSNKKEII